VEVEDLAVEVSTGVVLEVEVSTGVASMGAVSVVSTAVAFVVALWLPNMLEAESAAAAAESALADRTFQIAFRTLPAQDPGSPHLGDHRPGNLCMMDDLIEP
jgi:hypothetical protein